MSAELKRDTCAQEGVLCVCCWCKQARLSGLAGIKKSVKKRLKVDRLCQYCYRGLAQGQQSHVCNVSKEEAVNNLALNLPAEITAKLSHTYISSQVTVGGDCQPVLLPPGNGGHPLPINITSKTSKVLLEPLGHHEILAMKTEAGVSGCQMETVLANLRRKYGRDIVESGSADA